MSKSDIDFFLVGCDRSGTTLLRLMLNAHPNIAIPEESHFIIRLVERFGYDQCLNDAQVKEAYDILINFRRWQEWGNSEKQLWLKLESLVAPKVKDIINCAFELKLFETKKEIWGDKTPKYSLFIKPLSEMYPEAKFIHLVRDGRDVCLSFLKTEWLGPWVSKIAEYWSNRVQIASSSKYILSSDNYLEIQYEELVRDPEQTLRKATQFLNEEYTPIMLDYSDGFEQNLANRALKIHQKLKRKPKLEDLSRWKSELEWWKVLTFEAFASKSLKGYGYECKYSALGFILYPTTRLIVSSLTATASLRHNLSSVIKRK